MDPPSIKRVLSPLIINIRGPLGPVTYRTRPDGAVEVRRRRRGPGPAATSEAWLLCQDSVRKLDTYYRAMTWEQKALWGQCTKKVADNHLTCLGAFYHINLPRMLFGMPGIGLPPDRFKSQAMLLKSEDAIVPIHPDRNIHVWVSGTDKGGNDFDEDVGDINGEVEPPELLDFSCEATKALMDSAYISGTFTITVPGEEPPQPEPCWHGLQGAQDLAWSGFPMQDWKASWMAWYDYPVPGIYYFSYALWCNAGDPDAPAVYASHFEINLIDPPWHAAYRFLPQGEAPLNLYSDGTGSSNHTITLYTMDGCDLTYEVSIAMTFTPPD